MQSVNMFLAEGSALFLALSFLQVKGKYKILISLGLGAFGALFCGVLAALHLDVPDFVVSMLCGLVGALVLRGASDMEWTRIGIAVFMSVEMTEILMMAGRSFDVILAKSLSPLFVFGLCACSFLLSFFLSGLYPPQEFLEDFDVVKESGAEGKIWQSAWSLIGIFMLVAVVSMVCDVVLWREYKTIPPMALALCLILYLLFWAAVCLVSLLAKLCGMSHAMMSEKQYRAEMETFMNVIRSQRHDYNFHVQTIAGILRQNDLEACKKYIGELQQDSMEMNEVLPLHDPAISTTIYNFRGMAAKEGVRLHLDIQNDLSHIVTNVYETNKIISNLLQNALDEVKTHEDKSYGIRLYILKRGRYCVIHTVNEISRTRMAESISHIYQRGYTTKSGHDGVGLSSIKSLAERKHGVVYTRMEENLIHFVAKIPLKYEEGELEQPFTE